MASLQLAKKARALALQNKPARLYRSIVKEIPRVLMIYDVVNLGEADVKKQVRSLFYANADVQDARVQDMLVEKGYMDLEDTLLQHKQKMHLMLLLEGPIGTDFNNKKLTPDASELEQFQRWVH